MAHLFIHRRIPNCDPLILVFLLHVVQAPISPRAFSSKNLTRVPCKQGSSRCFPSLFEIFAFLCGLAAAPSPGACYLFVNETITSHLCTKMKHPPQIQH